MRQKRTDPAAMQVAWPTARLLEELEREESKLGLLASFLEDLRSELRVKAESDYTEAAVQNLIRRVFFLKDRESQSRQSQASMLCDTDLPALRLGSFSKPSPPQLQRVTVDWLLPPMHSHLRTRWDSLGVSVPSKVKARRDQGGRHFGPGAKVPQKPGDSLFEFEPTSIKVALKEGHEGAGVANALLDLFRDRRYIDEAAPIRVNEAEMWVQATIFKGLFCCELRASFYAEDPQACVVDLQCLGGDEFVFFWLFQLVERHLEGSGWVVVRGDDVGDGFGNGPPSLHDNVWVPKPMGEVAAMVFIPEAEDMQAEGALVLARIAQDPVERKHLLSNPQVFSKIRKLLKSDRLEVAWPTARLLEELEREESKLGLLASFLEDLRSELRVKAESDYTEAAVQNLIRRVFFHKDRESQSRQRQASMLSNVEGAAGGCKRQRV